MKLKSISLAIAFAALPVAPALASKAPPAAPGNPRAAAPHADPLMGQSVEEVMARSIARATLGLHGGLNVALWPSLGKHGFGTRYLTENQISFSSYPDFVAQFTGLSVLDPALVSTRVLLITGHGGQGLGLQTVVGNPAELHLPANLNWDREYAPLEFVAISRIRADIAGQYGMLVLGQCNARACLRSADRDIPIDAELIRQIARLSKRPRQLTIVRNPAEDIYMVGHEVVHREPYQSITGRGAWPKVVVPDGIGNQMISRNIDRNSQTDVFILAGAWTDKPTSELSDRQLRPTREMIRRAEQLVQTTMAQERQRGPQIATAPARRMPTARQPASP
jgi:hypothetical protein